MHEESKRHYLLTPHEAELLGCFRTLDENKQAAVASLIASLVPSGCQTFNDPAKLSLVRKA